MSSNGTTALVADFETSTVTPVNLPGLEPGPPVAVGGNPTGIAGAPGATTAWVSGGDSVTPFTLSDRRAGTAVSVGATAEGIAVEEGGGTAWVCTGDGNLVELDLQTGTVARRVAVGGRPSAVVIVPGRS